MSLNDITRHIRVLLRADAIIARIELHNLLNQFGLRALAALAAAGGVVSFELAGYFALLNVCDRVAAAALIGAANLIVAIAMFLLSKRERSGDDMDIAVDLHKSAMDALHGDAEALQAEIAMIRNALHRPVDSALASLIVPAASFLISALKKTKAT